MNQHQHPVEPPARTAPRLRGDRFTVVAALLAALFAPALWQGADLFGSEAAIAARDGERIGPPNAAQQRKEMIERLERIDERLEKLENVMGSGLEVRVLNFPEPVEDEDRRDDRESPRRGD